MKTLAKITVTTGPDRGTFFELAEELLQIGKGSDSGMVLNDPTLEDHQISIVRRNGRYAIFSPFAKDVEVDGTQIPADRWVWLPDAAQIRLNQRTALEFVALPGGANDIGTQSGQNDAAANSARSSEPPARPGRADTPPPTKSTGSGAGTVVKGKRPAAKRPEEKPAPNVARFITDQAGDPLVKLGEDGHFPELLLLEGQEAAPTSASSKGSNPLVLIAAFCGSVCLSLTLLFVDMEEVGSSSQKKAIARRAVTFFYANSEATPPQPYQALLGQARQAASQGHFGEERQRYRDVIELLRSENKNSITGLTMLDRAAQTRFEAMTNNDLAMLGNDFLNLNNDDKLARLISILLE